jgi:hypothetical protein
MKKGGKGEQERGRKGKDEEREARRYREHRQTKTGNGGEKEEEGSEVESTGRRTLIIAIRQIDPKPPRKSSKWSIFVIQAC